MYTIELILSNDDMKKVWFYWFCANPRYHPNNITIKKLRKHENSIMNYSFLWDDLFNRHNMNDKMPWNAEKQEKELYDHAIGNMIGIISSLIKR